MSVRLETSHYASILNSKRDEYLALLRDYYERLQTFCEFYGQTNAALKDNQRPALERFTELQTMLQPKPNEPDTRKSDRDLLDMHTGELIDIEAELTLLVQESGLPMPPILNVQRRWSRAEVWTKVWLRFAADPIAVERPQIRVVVDNTINPPPQHVAPPIQVVEPPKPVVEAPKVTPTAVAEPPPFIALDVVPEPKFNPPVPYEPYVPLLTLPDNYFDDDFDVQQPTGRLKRAPTIYSVWGTDFQLLVDGESLVGSVLREVSRTRRSKTPAKIERVRTSGAQVPVEYAGFRFTVNLISRQRWLSDRNEPDVDTPNFIVPPNLYKASGKAAEHVLVLFDDAIAADPFKQVRLLIDTGYHASSFRYEMAIAMHENMLIQGFEGYVGLSQLDRRCYKCCLVYGAWLHNRLNSELGSALLKAAHCFTVSWEEKGATKSAGCFSRAAAAGLFNEFRGSVKGELRFLLEKSDSELCRRVELATPYLAAMSLARILSPKSSANNGRIKTAAWRERWANVKNNEAFVAALEECVFSNATGIQTRPEDENKGLSPEQMKRLGLTRPMRINKRDETWG